MVRFQLVLSWRGGGVARELSGSFNMWKVGMDLFALRGNTIVYFFVSHVIQCVFEGERR